MSQALKQYHASAGDDDEFITLQLTSTAFVTRYLVSAFDDITAALEDTTLVTFEAAGLAVNLPKSATGAEMELQFGIDNVTGEARQLIEAARKAGADVFITLRKYMASDLTAPASKPIKFKVTTASTTRTNCSASAGIGYLSNSAWPRPRFTTEYAPGLATIS
ncbi:DUF1833 family protein [Vibrio alginolyticus]|uniref:DUF1833 family protein n=1 Tax=Vibrio alginolyticus TaxID=663 RepID=UPI001C9C5EE8|nr:DUF1833 family protein [Vibrio alginolyticus]MBY7682303.1 DUF1833 family protein [Vibrio alginolyticus]